MKRGFTLIETLVVVAIIALLAAILFPAFQSARGMARSAVCQSNLKQLGAAIQMYTQDYDRYPRGIDPSDKYAPEIWGSRPDVIAFLSTTPLLHSSEVMGPYVKNANVWKCPSDNGFDRPEKISVMLNNPVTGVKEPTAPSCFAKFDTSYFYRTDLTWYNKAPEDLSKPGEINILFDAYGNWHGAGYLGWKQKRFNVLFGDYHVKNISIDQLDEAWNIPVQ
jgi:prepilin-type N-terminal cleavage/methylation domain-containing protein